MCLRHSTTFQSNGFFKIEFLETLGGTLSSVGRKRKFGESEGYPEDSNFVLAKIEWTLGGGSHPLCFSFLSVFQSLIKRLVSQSWSFFVFIELYDVNASMTSHKCTGL